MKTNHLLVYIERERDRLGIYTALRIWAQPLDLLHLLTRMTRIPPVSPNLNGWKPGPESDGVHLALVFESQDVSPGFSSLTLSFSQLPNSLPAPHAKKNKEVCYGLLLCP